MGDEKKKIGRISETMITSRSFRKAFSNDPFAAAKGVGVESLSPKDLASLDAIAELTEDELDLLRTVRTKLLASNPDLASDVIGGVIF